MKRFRFRTVCCHFALGCLAIICTAEAQTIKKSSFIHPGMMQNRRDLDLMRANVKMGLQPWGAAFQRLIKAADTNSVISPVSHLSQGAYGTDDKGGRALLKNASDAYDCALLWYITRDRRYAQRAMKILNSWTTNLWDFDDNNAKLLAGLSGHFLLNAAEILRYSDAGWSVADIVRFKQLMLTVYYPLIYDFFPEANGNWDAAMINTMLDIGIFCDDRSIFNRAVAKYFRGNGNGGITRYIYPGGQIQEATRDWGHVQLGLGEFAKAAQVAWTQGVDFYGAADDRLARGFEYASKFMLGDTVPAYGKISQRERQSLRDIYESVYDHYHDIQHFQMPYTLRMIARTRPKTSQVLLSAVRFVAADSANSYKIFPEPGSDAIQTGELTAKINTPELPGRYLLVKPGEDVQKALDTASVHHQVVYLLRGIHPIGTGLHIYSGTTLKGEGAQSILLLNPGQSGTAISTLEANLHDVTISDLLLEGASDIPEGPDPNDGRRMRSFQKVPARAGIRLESFSGLGMTGVHFANLTIRHFTKSGISVSGADSLYITNCDVTDNGASVSPGPGQHHNLLLNRDNHVIIQNSRFDDSPFGSGLYMIRSRHVRLTKNEFARNHDHGTIIFDSSGIEVSGNRFEGNEKNGICCGKYFSGCRQISITGNLLYYNGQTGIKSQAGLEAVENIEKGKW